MLSGSIICRVALYGSSFSLRTLVVPTLGLLFHALPESHCRSLDFLLTAALAIKTGVRKTRVSVAQGHGPSVLQVLPSRLAATFASAKVELLLSL